MTLASSITRRLLHEVTCDGYYRWQSTHHHLLSASHLSWLQQSSRRLSDIPAKVPTGWLYGGPVQKEAAAAAEKKAGWSLSRMFFWRKNPDGSVQPMHTWEKLYWGVGVTGMTAWLFSRVEQRMHKEEDQDKVKARAELEVKRVAALPAVRHGKSFLEGDDVFDGMAPGEIAALAQKHFDSGGRGSGGGGLFSSDDDPFDGMTPEEIDAYAAKHGLTS